VCFREVQYITNHVWYRCVKLEEDARNSIMNLNADVRIERMSNVMYGVILSLQATLPAAQGDKMLVSR
jgi:hypothetical protein